MIEPDIAKAVTAGCPRQDCRIKMEPGETTCMGWSGQEYNRDGVRTDLGDPNKWHFLAACRRCDRQWNVRTRYETVEAVEPRQATRHG